MKKIRQRVGAALAAALMLVMTPSTALDKTVSAVEDQEEYEYDYKISGYDDQARVFTTEMVEVPGCIGFCMDAKSSTPDMDHSYRRIRLSELEEYTLTIDNPDHTKDVVTRTYTERQKLRILRFLLSFKELNDLYDNYDITPYVETVVNKEFISDGSVDFGSGTGSTHKIKLSHFNCGDENCPYKNQSYSINGVKKDYRDGKLTAEQYKHLLGHALAEKYYYTMSKTKYKQKLLWAIVHDDSYWPTLVKDNGSDDKHKDNYSISETNAWYISDDPMNDDDSLWNVFYKPMIDEIDKQTYTFDQGYDAWVYICNENTEQNVLSSAFMKSSFKVSKINDDNASLKGASFEVFDSAGELVDFWTTDGTAHEVEDIYTNELYRVHEKTAPAGYKAAEDKYVLVDNDGKVSVYKGEETKTEYYTYTYPSKDSSSVKENTMLVRNNITEVAVSKTDIDGKEIPGAGMKLTGKADWDTVISYFDENDTHNIEKVLDDAGDTIGISWTSTGTELLVNGLDLDEEYTVTETAAPDGYYYSNDIKFKIVEDEEGNRTVKVYDEKAGGYVDADAVQMIDEATEVEVVKVDADTNEKLEGAVFELSDETGVIKTFTVEKDGYVILGELSVGKTYTLHEKTPPEDYEAAEDITIVINKDGTLTVNGVVQDSNIITVRDAKVVSPQDEDSNSDTNGSRTDSAPGDDDSNSGDDDPKDSNTDNSGADDSNNSGTDSDSNSGADDSNNSGSSSGGNNNSNSSKSNASNGGNGGSNDGNPATGLGGLAVPAVAVVLLAGLVVRRKSDEN